MIIPPKYYISQFYFIHKTKQIQASHKSKNWLFKTGVHHYSFIFKDQFLVLFCFLIL